MNSGFRVSILRGWNRSLYLLYISCAHVICSHLMSSAFPNITLNRELLKDNYGRVLLNCSRRLDLNNNRIMNRLQLQEKMERLPPLFLLGKQKLIVHNGHNPPFDLGILCSVCETSDEYMYRQHIHLSVD